MRYSNPNGNGAKPFLTKLAEEKPENALKYAAVYAGMGLLVVPNEGKKPLLKGWTESQLTEEEVPLHFGNGQNVGLVLGEPSNGLVATDIDTAEALTIADQFLPQTLVGGRKSTPKAHRYYRAPGAKTMKWQDTDGTMLLEVRSTGCQMLVEPSVHPETGEPYRWVREGTLEAVETVAEDLEKRCTKLATATVIARHLPPIGGRHEYAKAVVGYLLRRLDEDIVRQIVLAAWQAGEGDSEDAVRDLEGIIEDTTRRLAEGENAFGSPKLEEMAPGLPKLLDIWWGWNSGERARIGGLVVGDEGPPTHDELRDRFSAANPHHAHGLGEWRHYEVGVWIPVPEFLVKRRIVAVLEEAKPERIKPTSGLLSSVHELSRVELAVPDEQWDSDQDILVCGNGALHIPTGELLPHSPAHFATGAVPYDYDPDATAPTWEQVLEDVLGKELASFFQEFAGYSATPDTSLETALWLCGQPGGGRSTLLAGLETMLGPRAGVLGLGEIERNRFALAQIPGKFLLTATEQPAGYMRVSHTLNALISGEPLQVERKFRDPFTLVPRCKIAWAMNELPRLKSTSDGLLRRVKVIELDPIPENERDPEVKNKVREEGPGILTWAMEGQRRVKQRGGFLIPETVKDATEEFGLSNDVPKSFVQEACITGKESEEQAGPLYKAYRHYCLEHGHQPMSAKSVAKEWKRLGFGTRGLHGRTVYKGVKVDPKWIGEQDDYPRSR